MKKVKISFAALAFVLAIGGAVTTKAGGGPETDCNTVTCDATPEVTCCSFFIDGQPSDDTLEGEIEP